MIKFITITIVLIVGFGLIMILALCNISGEDEYYKEG